MNSRGLIFAILILFAFPAAAESDQKIKVGVIIGLSGSMANAGTEMKKGMDLGMDVLKDRGRKDIELIYEDDESMEHKVAVSAISKLIHVDKVQLILNWVNTTMPTIMPIATKAKIPVVEFWDSNEGMFKLSPYVYSSGLSTEKTGSMMADYAVKDGGHQKVGMFVMNDPWSELIARSFKERVLENKAELVFEDKIDIEEKDVRALVLKLKRASAGGVFLPLCMTSLYSSVRQLRELKFEGDIYIADCMVEDEIKVLGKFGDGAYACNFYLENEEFNSRYAQKFNINPSGVSAGYAALGYDAVMIVDAVFNELDQQGMEKNSENIKKLLDTFSYDGVTGKAMLRGVSTKVENILKLENGKFKKIR